MYKNKYGTFELEQKNEKKISENDQNKQKELLMIDKFRSVIPEVGACGVTQYSFTNYSISFRVVEKESVKEVVEKIEHYFELERQKAESNPSTAIYSSMIPFFCCYNFLGKNKVVADISIESKETGIMMTIGGSTAKKILKAINDKIEQDDEKLYSLNDNKDKESFCKIM